MEKFNLLRTTDSILRINWEDSEAIINKSAPIITDWNYKDSISIEDVSIWEQLHHEPGIFGLFVSWNPYIEFYMLVFYGIDDPVKKTKTFYGLDSCFEVRKILENYGVDLEILDINSMTLEK